MGYEKLNKNLCFISKRHLNQMPYRIGYQKA